MRFNFAFALRSESRSAMSVVPLTVLDDPRLEPYRHLKFTNEMNRSGLFVAEGDKLARRLLCSGLRVHSVLVGERFLASGALEIAPTVTTFVMPDALLQELVGFKFHRGVLACGYRGTEPLLSEVMSRHGVSYLRPGEQASRLLSPHGTSAGSKVAHGTTAVVVCVNIEDPTNLGTILRTAEAFGVTAVLLGGHTADPFSRRVLRVSMGSPFQLPIVHCSDLSRDLTALRDDWRISLIGAVADSTGEPLEQVVGLDRFALLLGNESEGLGPEWIAHCDRRVTIPMQPRADSLNVAVATGILLHHFCELPQRGETSNLMYNSE